MAANGHSYQQRIIKWKDEATVLTKSAAMSGVILSMNSASVPALAASLYDAISYYSNTTHTHIRAQGASYTQMQVPTHTQYICSKICAHMHTHVRTYKHTHTYIHIYTHTNHTAGFFHKTLIFVTTLRHYNLFTITIQTL